MDYQFTSGGCPPPSVPVPGLVNEDFYEPSVLPVTLPCHHH